ncbi:hypothetical protein DFH09DRAFT_1111261 [Mycena vulgaris]|nr:hypothetical protein DFH09DRAFT_1111261 [Mycena vulgaris]
MAEMREGTWLRAGVMPSGVFCLHALGTATGFYLSGPAPPPATQDPSARTHNINCTQAIPLAQRGTEWRPAQLARRLDDRDDDTDNARMARREPADDQHPLHASRRLSVVKPTLHEAPTDDSPPLPPPTKRKSPDLREEGIHKRLRMRCPAEAGILARFASFMLRARSKGVCRHAARHTSVHRVRLSPPLAISLHRCIRRHGRWALLPRALAADEGG